MGACLFAVSVSRLEPLLSLAKVGALRSRKERACAKRRRKAGVHTRAQVSVSMNVGAVVNDTPVACQSRDPTEPAGETLDPALAKSRPREIPPSRNPALAKSRPRPLVGATWSYVKGSVLCRFGF